MDRYYRDSGPFGEFKFNEMYENDDGFPVTEFKHEDDDSYIRIWSVISKYHLFYIVFDAESEDAFGRDSDLLKSSKVRQVNYYLVS